MNVERRTLDTLDVPLPGNPTLRLALYRTADGEAETLVLSLGRGAGREWREDRELHRGEGIELPASIFRELRKALATLTAPAP